MHRLSLLFLLTVGACDNSRPTTSKPESPTPQATVGTQATAAEAAISAPTAVPPGSWYLGNWKGESSATRRISTTTTKQGGPGAWEKDDGNKLAGTFTIELSIGADGNVTGAVKGALGELVLRGKIDGDDLRAVLVGHGDELSQIHNGVLLLTREADTLKGRLTAASGDALALRQAEILLKRLTS